MAKNTRSAVDGFSEEQFKVDQENSAKELSKLKEVESCRKKPLRGQEIDFFKLPRQLVRELTKANSAKAWALAHAIYESWYDRYQRENPVRLTGPICQKYGISRYQKLRALKVLEKTGWFTVEGTSGENPWVTMTWLQTWDRPKKRSRF
jgi:hypothetical protein